MSNSVNIYQTILNNHTDCLGILKDISKAKKDNEPHFINSDLQMLNFDRLAKKLGNVVKSPDGLYFNNSALLFLEFKDRHLKNVDINDLKGKLYEGLSVFSFLLYKPLSKLNIKYIIICNPEKNQVKNPVQQTMQNRINNEVIDKDENTLRVTPKINELNRYFRSLKNLNIYIDIDIIITENKLFTFIQSLQ